jgi:general secretion pathway protein H
LRRRSGTTSPPTQRHGFTLLEMLVVLVMLALATGIVAPRAAGWLDAARERGWRDDLRAYLEVLPVRTFIAGEPLVLEAKDLLAAVPGAPAQTEIRLPTPIRYDALGVATGGTVELRRGNAREVWRIEPVTGRVHDGG